jgi:hypothetical protein
VVLRRCSWIKSYRTTDLSASRRESLPASSTLSQQLAVLRKSNIVVGRKEAQNLFYSVADRAIFRLLDDARQVFNNHLRREP